MHNLQKVTVLLTVVLVICVADKHDAFSNSMEGRKLD